MVSYSRIIASILGIGVVVTAGLGFSVAPEGGFAILATLLLLLYHFIFAMVALPFLLYGMKQPGSPTFDLIIMIESALAGILIFSSGIYYGIEFQFELTQYLFFVFPAILNLGITYYAYGHYKMDKADADLNNNILNIKH